MMKDKELWIRYMQERELQLQPVESVDMSSVREEELKKAVLLMGYRTTEEDLKETVETKRIIFS